MDVVSAFKLEVRADRIAVITIDAPGEKMNTLKAESDNQMRGLIRRVRDDKSVCGVVFISAKADNFIADADISMIARYRSAQEVEALTRQGQQIMAEIHGLSIPVIAAIHDAYLDGGLELALTCHGRICSDDEKTRLGLSKVQLGLLSGSGGTQRLPRPIGVSTALDMTLTGRQLRACQALKAGLVDEVVPQAILLQAAMELALKGRPASRDMPVRERVLAGPLGRHLLFHFVGKQTQRKTQGNYLAVKRILQVVGNDLIRGCSNGYVEEARAFGGLAMTPQPQTLRSIFFANTDPKKDRGAEAESGPLASTAVLGGGLMGEGIAHATACKGGLPVRVKDIQPRGTSHALKYSWDLLNKQVRQRRLRSNEHDHQTTPISGATDCQGFAHRDVVIEAVFEDLVLKQRMVGEVKQYCGPQTIFTSNTSSLPIGDIAAHASRPEQVIGLHFFSPVEKMSPVEVIPHKGIDPQAIATVVQLAEHQGKTPIVAADKASFYVNRILAPYINEAMRLLVEGEPVEEIDRALIKFGFPVGPIQLLDKVGTDAGTKITPMLGSAFGKRFSPPTNIIDVILKDDRKGRKNNRGFYLYETKGRKSKKRPDPAVYPLLGIDRPQSRLSAQQVARRCVMMMLNGAARCSDEQIIRSVRGGDIGAAFGIGFPPFLGGPFRHMDTIGASKVAAILQRLAAQCGPRFTLCDTLLRMAEQGTTFWLADERLT